MLEEDEMNKMVMKLVDNQILHKLDDSLIWLFNLESGEYYNLNESSYFVLSLFDGKKSVNDLLQLYVKKYSERGIEEAILVEDFNSLLSNLINDNIITLIK